MIRGEIAAVNLGQEFQSSIIADLIHQNITTAQRNAFALLAFENYTAQEQFTISKAAFRAMAGTESHGRSALTLETKWPG